MSNSSSSLSVDPATIVPSAVNPTIPSSTPNLAVPPPSPTPGITSITPQQGNSSVPTPAIGQPAAPTTTGTTKLNLGKNGLGGGAVAGIAIGMLLVGILISGAIFFFISRRQKRKQAISYEVSHLPPASYTSSPEKGPVVVASAALSSIDDLIPQPVSDDTLTDEISKIRDNIKNYVRTYYHSAPVTAGINEAGLRSIASAVGLSDSALVGALSNPSTRQDALRLVVAWVVLSKSLGGRNAALLPADVAGLSTTMFSTIGNTAQATLYSKWKTVTGVLLQQYLGKNAQDPSFTQRLAGISAEVDLVLAPFVQRSIDDAQRRKKLDMIITRSAKFAFLLFSQPGSFQFDFTTQRSGMVAFPALLQVAGDQGQALSLSKVLYSGETVAA